MTQQKPPTSAAADLEELRRFALDLEDRHLHGKRANIDDAFKWNQVVRIIGKLAALEAQQTDDTLRPRKSDLAERMRRWAEEAPIAQRGELRTVMKAWADEVEADDTLSGLRTQIEAQMKDAQKFFDAVMKEAKEDGWDNDRGQYASRMEAKVSSLKWVLSLLDSAEARKKHVRDPAV